MPEDNTFAPQHGQHQTPRQKPVIYIVVSIILGLALLGSLTFHFIGGSDEEQPIVQSPSHQTFGGGSGGVRMHGGSGGSRGMRIKVESFFNPDGSINQDMVQQFNANISNAPDPAAALTQMGQEIDKAVSDGTITQSQAIKLKAALGIS